jgi:hypothetical protein
LRCFQRGVRGGAPGRGKSGYTPQPATDCRSDRTRAMRRRLAIICNLVVPGSGLIVLRREWFGVAVAVLFGILAEVVLLGVLIVPATIPPWVTTLCFSAALFVWLGGQWRLWVRLRSADGPALEGELALLRERAAAAASERSYARATDIVRVALTLNDEDLACNVQQAELMTLMGRFAQARRAWRRVQSLDRKGEYRQQVADALAALPEK